MSNGDVVERFRTVVFDIIKEASNYAGQAEVDEDISAAIRQIQTLSSALNGALMQIRVMQQSTGPMAAPMTAPMAPPINR